jgi:hypothetical protein
MIKGMFSVCFDVYIMDVMAYSLRHILDGLTHAYGMFWHMFEDFILDILSHGLRCVITLNFLGYFSLFLPFLKP